MRKQNTPVKSRGNSNISCMCVGVSVSGLVVCCGSPLRSLLLLLVALFFFVLCFFLPFLRRLFVVRFGLCVCCVLVLLPSRCHVPSVTNVTTLPTICSRSSVPCCLLACRNIVGPAAMSEKVDLPEPALSDAAKALVAQIVAAGDEVRRLKSEKKNIDEALAQLIAAKKAFKTETGKEYVCLSFSVPRCPVAVFCSLLRQLHLYCTVLCSYVAPGAKKSNSKVALKKAAKAAKKAAEKERRAAEAAKLKDAYQPRYIAPDNSKLKPDTRPEPVQPERVTVDETFYLTTAINYTNGKPHIGHAYEGVTSDVISRYHRTFGRSVWFLTGSDEHGKKVQQSAEAAGVEPIEIANKYSKGFQALNASVSPVLSLRRL